MATTQIERLVEWLRDKIGDNPVDENNRADESLQIWSDPELVDVLTDSLISLFKGRKTGFDNLTTLEQSWLVKKARIELTLTLAINAARYAKYTLRDVTAERLSPESFLSIYDTLKEGLTEEMNNSDEGSSLGPEVQEGIILLYDPDYDLLRPTRYQKPNSVPEFVLSQVATGVKIFIPYSFIVDYRSHILKRMSPGDETILGSFYDLGELEYIDTFAVSSGTYTYRLMIESINGNYSSKDKSIVITI